MNRDTIQKAEEALENLKFQRKKMEETCMEEKISILELPKKKILSEKEKERNNSIVEEIYCNIKKERRNSKMEEKEVSFKEINYEDNNSIRNFYDITEGEKVNKAIFDLFKKASDLTNEKYKDKDKKIKSKFVANMISLMDDMKLAVDFLSAITKEEVTDSFSILDARDIKEAIDLNSLEDSNNILSMRKYHEGLKSKCTCLDCRVSKGLVKSMVGGFKNRNREVKEILLTTGLKMTISIHKSTTMAMQSVKKNGQRRVTFLNKSDNKEICNMLFEETQEMKRRGYDFSKYTNINLRDYRYPLDLEVTYSSFMVVTTIRAMSEEMSQIYEVPMFCNEKMKDFTHIPNGNCFLKMICKFTKRDWDKKMEVLEYHSLDSLNPWLEMLFLQNCRERYLYIRFTSKYDIYNHISTNNFFGAIKIKAYLLVCPMFRYVQFYNDEEEEKEDENLTFEVRKEMKIKELGLVRFNDISFPHLKKMYTPKEMLMEYNDMKFNKMTLEEIKESLLPKEEWMKKNLMMAFNKDMAKIYSFMLNSFDHRKECMYDITKDDLFYFFFGFNEVMEATHFLFSSSTNEMLLRYTLMKEMEKSNLSYLNNFDGRMLDLESVDLEEQEGKTCPTCRPGSRTPPSPTG